MLTIDTIGALSILMCALAMIVGACALAIALSPDGKAHRRGWDHPRERKRGKWID
jgi:hypothetical protein